MRHFSEVYGIGLDQSQLDFVDVSPWKDTPLFIDPFAISTRQDDWSRRCHQHIVHFFQTALDFVRSGHEKEAKMLLNGLSEPNETCLGLSQGVPAGRGVSGKQAVDLYQSLANSQAAKSGLLEELAEFDLFIEGVGPDKTSDITTNIIRRLLIQYTLDQCKLHGIELVGTHPTGRFWDIDNVCWRSEYTPLPVIDGRRIILVPKYSVRRRMAINSQEYYSHHITSYIQQEEFNRGSPLVRVLKNGDRRPPYKRDIKTNFPFSKDFVARFSQENPQVLADYKKLYMSLEGASGILKHVEFDEDFDEALLAGALIGRLSSIPVGPATANDFHGLIVGILEFIFWPNLIYPEKEAQIHEGRKRIDIRYTNAATGGFFYRVHTAHEIASNFVMVECKNYTADPANPEIDQLSGRFSVNRGRLGILVYRNVSDYDRLVRRCKDTAQDGRGIILPLGDIELVQFLDLIANKNRSAIEFKLEQLLGKIIS